MSLGCLCYSLLNREWPDKKERAKCNEHKLECEKGDNFTKIVSTTLLIAWLKKQILRNLYTAAPIINPFFLTNFLRCNKISLSLSNPEILCEEYLL